MSNGPAMCACRAGRAVNPEGEASHMVTVILFAALIAGAVFAVLLAFGLGKAAATRPTDPHAPGLVDVSPVTLCPYETVCPSDPHGHIEPCELEAGHDGPHQHPHTLAEDDPGSWYPCMGAVPAPVPGDPDGACCLEAGHAGPHLLAIAIGAGGYAPGQRR